MTDDEKARLVKLMSKAIHMEEWCSERDRCSGTSAHSDAAAKAALKAIDAAGYVVTEKETP